MTGGLSNASGKSSSFRVSVTVWSGGSGGTTPPVEGGTSPGASTSLTSAGGFATVTVPAGAWAPNGKDWIVIRIQTIAPPSLANGFAPASRVVNVTAYWALSGQAVHHFDKPIEILLRTSGSGLVSATFEAGGWRGLRRMPSATRPGGWEDGFTADSSSFLLRTLHLSQFTVLRDVEAPATPTNVLGFLIGGHLTLGWTPGAASWSLSSTSTSSACVSCTTCTPSSRRCAWSPCRRARRRSRRPRRPGRRSRCRARCRTPCWPS